MTLILIGMSYSLNHIPIGSAVMILHDITDTTMNIFKVTIDVTPIPIQAVSYFLMLFSWIYLRLWYFPFYVIGSIFEETNDFSRPEINNSVL